MRDLDDFPKPKRADARPASKALTEWVKQYFVSLSIYSSLTKFRSLFVL